MTNPAAATIRVYEEADFSGVKALWEEVFPGDPLWNAPERIIRSKQRVQPELFFVARTDSRVVGTVLAGYDGVRGWIYHLAVHPGCRRRGIGAALMRRAEEALAALDCPKVNLQVRADNTGAVSFYADIGFAAEERLSMGKRLG